MCTQFSAYRTTSSPHKPRETIITSTSKNSIQKDQRKPHHAHGTEMQPPTTSQCRRGCCCCWCRNRQIVLRSSLLSVATGRVLHNYARHSRSKRARCVQNTHTRSTDTKHKTHRTRRSCCLSVNKLYCCRELRGRGAICSQTTTTTTTTTIDKRGCATCG